MDSKLYEAVTRDHIAALKEMEKSLQVGDQLTPTNSTVLHLACQYGSINCVKEILSVHESLLLKTNSRGETVLHLAASQGHYDVVVALIDAAKSSRLQPNNLTTDTSLTVVQILIRATSLELETALHKAIRCECQDVVQLLVQEDPSHSHPKNKYNETPLYLASIKCEYAIIDTILKNCTSPTFGGPDGRTPLHAAAMNRNGSECMRLLLTKMKDLIKVADDYGWTAFHYVAFNDIDSIVEDLVNEDKSVGYLVENEYKRTALHIAALAGNQNVLMELVRYYPDCWEIVDVNGKNLLHIAVERYSTYLEQDMIDYILARGFEASNNLLYQRDNEGNTPLHLMAKLECYVPQLMDPGMRIDWNIDWNVPDYKNVTPLDILQDRYMTDAFDIVGDQALVRRTLDFSRGILNIWSLLKRKHTKKVLAQTSKLQKLYLPEREREREPEPEPEPEQEPEPVPEPERNEKELEVYRSVINTHMIVGALITTVALTAGFAMPGGFDQNQGSAVLLRKPAFKTFIAADTVALLFSISSLILYFIATRYKKAFKVRVLIVLAAVLNVSSIIAMMVAFTAGTYAVLAPSSGIAISVCVVASIFFLLAFYIFAKLFPSFMRLVKSRDAQKAGPHLENPENESFNFR